jgi:hypothetical protein
LKRGLETEIAQDNIGFKLLAKMGFKHGDALGQTTKDQGLTVPIPITLKTGKSGLGGFTEDYEELTPSLKKRRGESETQDMDAQLTVKKDQFKASLLSKYEEKRVSADVHKSRKVIEQMDMAHEVEKSAFWPSRASQDVDTGEWIRPDPTAFELQDPREQLGQVIGYLRKTYNYCIWCGCRFESPEEMTSECPGETREAHDDL